MTSSLHFLFLCFFFFFTFTCADQQQQPQTRAQRPSALVLPIRRDEPTHLYVADIHKRTPQLPVPFVIDLNGRFLWVNCEHEYLSSTYRAPQYHSTQCSMANTHVCRTCSSSPPPPPQSAFSFDLNLPFERRVVVNVNGCGGGGALSTGFALGEFLETSVLKRCQEAEEEDVKLKKQHTCVDQVVPQTQTQSSFFASSVRRGLAIDLNHPLPPQT